VNPAASYSGELILHSVREQLPESRPVRETLTAFAPTARTRLETDGTSQLVFDYGNHIQMRLTPWPSRPWARAAGHLLVAAGSGSKVRTYRRCHSVLLFHRFEEVGAGPV